MEERKLFKRKNAPISPISGNEMEDDGHENVNREPSGPKCRKLDIGSLEDDQNETVNQEPVGLETRKVEENSNQNETVNWKPVCLESGKIEENSDDIPKAVLDRILTALKEANSIDASTLVKVEEIVSKLGKQEVGCKLAEEEICLSSPLSPNPVMISTYVNGKKMSSTFFNEVIPFVSLPDCQIEQWNKAKESDSNQFLNRDNLFSQKSLDLSVTECNTLGNKLINSTMPIEITKIACNAKFYTDRCENTPIENAYRNNLEEFTFSRNKLYANKQLSDGKLQPKELKETLHNYKSTVYQREDTVYQTEALLCQTEDTAYQPEDTNYETEDTVYPLTPKRSRYDGLDDFEPNFDDYSDPGYGSPMHKERPNCMDRSVNFEPDCGNNTSINTNVVGNKEVKIDQNKHVFKKNRKTDEFKNDSSLSENIRKTKLIGDNSQKDNSDDDALSLQTDSEFSDDDSISQTDYTDGGLKGYRNKSIYSQTEIGKENLKDNKKSTHSSKMSREIAVNPECATKSAQSSQVTHLPRNDVSFTDYVRAKLLRICYRYLKHGACFREDCTFPHQIPKYMFYNQLYRDNSEIVIEELRGMRGRFKFNIHPIALNEILKLIVSFDCITELDLIAEELLSGFTSYEEDNARMVLLFEKGYQKFNLLPWQALKRILRHFVISEHGTLSSEFLGPFINMIFEKFGSSIQRNIWSALTPLIEKNVLPTLSKEIIITMVQSIKGHGAPRQIIFAQFGYLCSILNCDVSLRSDILKEKSSLNFQLLLTKLNIDEMPSSNLAEEITKCKRSVAALFPIKEKSALNYPLPKLRSLEHFPRYSGGCSLQSIPTNPILIAASSADKSFTSVNNAANVGASTSSIRNNFSPGKRISAYSDKSFSSISSANITDISTSNIRGNFSPGKRISPYSDTDKFKSKYNDESLVSSSTIGLKIPPLSTTNANIGFSNLPHQSFSNVNNTYNCKQNSDINTARFDKQFQKSDFNEPCCDYTTNAPRNLADLESWNNIPSTSFTLRPSLNQSISRSLTPNHLTPIPTRFASQKTERLDRKVNFTYPKDSHCSSFFRNVSDPIESRPNFSYQFLKRGPLPECTEPENTGYYSEMATSSYNDRVTDAIKMNTSIDNQAELNEREQNIFRRTRLNIVSRNEEEIDITPDHQHYRDRKIIAPHMIQKTISQLSDSTFRTNNFRDIPECHFTGKQQQLNIPHENSLSVKYINNNNFTGDSNTERLYQQRYNDKPIKLDERQVVRQRHKGMPYGTMFTTTIINEGNTKEIRNRASLTNPCEIKFGVKFNNPENAAKIRNFSKTLPYNIKLESGVERDIPEYTPYAREHVTGQCHNNGSGSIRASEYVNEVAKRGNNHHPIKEPNRIKLEEELATGNDAGDVDESFLGSNFDVHKKQIASSLFYTTDDDVRSVNIKIVCEIFNVWSSNEKALEILFRTATNCLVNIKDIHKINPLYCSFLRCSKEVCKGKKIAETIGCQLIMHFLEVEHMDKKAVYIVRTMESEDVYVTDCNVFAQKNNIKFSLLFKVGYLLMGERQEEVVLRILSANPMLFEDVTCKTSNHVTDLVRFIQAFYNSLRIGNHMHLMYNLVVEILESQKNLIFPIDLSFYFTRSLETLLRADLYKMALNLFVAFEKYIQMYIEETTLRELVICSVREKDIDLGKIIYARYVPRPSNPIFSTLTIHSSLADEEIYMLLYVFYENMKKEYLRYYHDERKKIVILDRCSEIFVKESVYKGRPTNYIKINDDSVNSTIERIISVAANGFSYILVEKINISKSVMCLHRQKILDHLEATEGKPTIKLEP